MPTGNLPSEAKAIWEKVYESAKKSSTCKDAGDRRDECAARVAWTAVKNAGWKKVGDTWHKSADLQEFSLTIKKAVFDEPTQEMRWRADTSDVDDDSYGDNMTLQLFEDFVGRIKANEQAPEEYRSEFWSGGMPYLSVSHYLDLNGDGVPGMPDNVYVDGKFLKAVGKYYDTPLGRACFKAACKSVHSKDDDEKIRISIAFLDWSHKHKSNGYLFERKSLDDLCPECILELIKNEYKGRSFLKGQLVHFAHTTVPVNKRTEIAAEVEKSMAKTRKDDAAAIVGEELAEELEKKSKELVGKSEALIVKSDDEPEETITDETVPDGVVVQEAEHVKDMPANKHAEDEEYPDCKDEKTGEMDQDCVKMHQKKSDAVEKAEVVEKMMGEPATAEYVYKPFGGATSLKDARAVIETQKEKMRISDLWYALQSVMENIATDETVKDKAKALSTVVGEFKEMMADKSATIYNAFVTMSTTKEEIPVHPLDQAIAALKADFDEVAKAELSADEKLQAFQSAFATFGNSLAETLKSTAIAKADVQPANADIAEIVARAIAPLAQKVELLTQMSQQRPALPVAVPERRSINPALVQQSVAAGNSNVSPLRKLMNRSVGLPENTP